MRTTLFLIASLALGTVPATNANAQSTTRIETNPSYGAIVTIENGVKVYRVLPRHDRVIINPGGKTPLHLGYEQVTVDEHNYNYDYGPAYYDTPSYGYGGYWGYGPGWNGKNRGFRRPGFGFRGFKDRGFKNRGFKNRGFGHRGGRSGLGFGRGGGGHKGGRGGGAGHSGRR